MYGIQLNSAIKTVVVTELNAVKMMDLVKQKWHPLTDEQRRQFLKRFFFEVIFTKNDCQELMDEEDWNQMFENSYVHYNVFRGEEEFCIVVDCEFFIYSQGWEPFTEDFDDLLDFFKKYIQQWPVGNLQLFNQVDMNGLKLYVRFNPTAFFQWMSTLDLETLDFSL